MFSMRILFLSKSLKLRRLQTKVEWFDIKGGMRIKSRQMYVKSAFVGSALCALRIVNCQIKVNAIVTIQAT